jgi:excisionase family DNA binding protein
MDSDVLGGLRTLSVRELAKAMGLQSWRVYEMITDGTAPPFLRIGRTYRFRVRDVDAWMDKQSRQKERAS